MVAPGKGFICGFASQARQIGDHIATINTGGEVMKRAFLVAILSTGLLIPVAEPLIGATSKQSTRRRGRNRRARNIGIGTVGGAAAGAVAGRGRGAGIGALAGGTAGALVPTRRRR